MLCIEFFGFLSNLNVNSATGHEFVFIIICLYPLSLHLTRSGTRLNFPDHHKGAAGEKACAGGDIRGKNTLSLT